MHTGRHKHTLLNERTKANHGTHIPDEWCAAGNNLYMEQILRVLCVCVSVCVCVFVCVFHVYGWLYLGGYTYSNKLVAHM